MRKRLSADDSEEENAVAAARKKARIVMIQVLSRKSTNVEEMLMKIAHDQLPLLIPSARATEAVETKTSIESANETVIGSIDHLTNTAQAAVLIGTIDHEVEIAIESVSTATVTAVLEREGIWPTHLSLHRQALILIISGIKHRCYLRSAHGIQYPSGSRIS